MEEGYILFNKNTNDYQLGKYYRLLSDFTKTFNGNTDLDKVKRERSNCCNELLDRISY